MENSSQAQLAHVQDKNSEAHTLERVMRHAQNCVSDDLVEFPKLRTMKHEFVAAFCWANFQKCRPEMAEWLTGFLSAGAPDPATDEEVFGHISMGFLTLGLADEGGTH